MRPARYPRRACPLPRCLISALPFFFFSAALAYEAPADAAFPSPPRQPAVWLLEFQWDSRGFPVTHLDYREARPGVWANTGYIDYQGRPGFDGSDHFSLQRHIIEFHHARWIADAFALDAELNSLTGNAVQGRLGLRWYPPVSLGRGARLFVRVTPLQTGGGGGQVSLVAGGPLGGRWSWNTWWDISTERSLGGHAKVISEVKVRYRLPNGNALTAEYRLNAFRPPGVSDGVAIGLEFPLN